MSEFHSFHIFFVYFLLILELIYFAFTQIQGNIHKHIFRIRVLLPLYYLVIACVFFTGILLEALSQFGDFHWLMLISIIIILAISIFQAIKFKRLRRAKKYLEFKRLSLVLGLLKLFILIGCARVLF